MIFFSGLITHISDHNEIASIILIEAPRPQGGACGLKLPVKAIAKPAGKDKIIPDRNREAAGKCARHHRSFARKVNDFLHPLEKSQDRNRLGGHDRFIYAKTCFSIDYVDSFGEMATILATFLLPSEGLPKQPVLIILFNSDVLQIFCAADTEDAGFSNRKRLLTERGHDQPTAKRPKENRPVFPSLSAERFERTSPLFYHTAYTDPHDSFLAAFASRIFRQ
jgi:hypothetical protein